MTICYNIGGSETTIGTHIKLLFHAGGSLHAFVMR